MVPGAFLQSAGARRENRNSGEYRYEKIYGKGERTASPSCEITCLLPTASSDVRHLFLLILGFVLPLREVGLASPGSTR